MFRYLFVFIFLLFSANSYAVDYYWYNNFEGTSVHYSSPSLSCDGALAYHRANLYPNATLKSEAVTVSVNQWRCYLYAYGPSNPAATLTVNIYRGGDSCPVGSQYDPSVGKCVAPEPDPCLSELGEFVHEYNAGSLDPSVPPSLPPSSICQNSCLYNRTPTVKGCNRFLESTTGKDLDSVYCKVVYQGAGSSCTTNNPPPGSLFDQPPAKPPADSTPQFTSDNQCGEWVTNADGSQTRNCNSTEQLKEPGQLNCDNAGDFLQCTTGKPSPRFEETSKTEQTTKSTNPDGSGTTVTSTTTDKTVCVGTKPCTSTTANEASTSGTNADGTPGDESKACTGNGCTSDGTDETGDEEGTDRTASAGSCDAGFSCSGDPIDCEFLRQQKQQLCLAEDSLDYNKHSAEIDQLIQGPEFQVKEETFEIPSFATGATRFLPSSGCPVPTRDTLRSGLTLEFDYTPFCGFAEGIAPVVVSLALLLAALYVGRGLGGA